MKRLVLMVFLFGVVFGGTAHADFWGRLAQKIKDETTNVLQPVEKTVRKAGEDIGREGGKAWEDIKEGTTDMLKKKRRCRLANCDPVTKECKAVVCE